MYNFSKWKVTFVFVICLLLTLVALPNFIQNKPNWFPNTKVNYGLDLQGGSQLLLKVDFKSYIKDQLSINTDVLRKLLRKEKIQYTKLRSNDSQMLFAIKNPEDSKKTRKVLKNLGGNFAVHTGDDNSYMLTYTEEKLISLREQIIDQTREIVRHRVDETGTLEPSITKQGEFGILLQVPGLQDPDHLKKILGRTAKLTFNFVDERSSVDQAKKGLAPSNLKLLSSDDGVLYLIEKKSILTGSSLIDAQISSSANSQPAVSFSLDTMGARLFAEATRNNKGRRLAIILDDKVISAPSINDAILTGSGIISGNFTINSANELALLLRAGSLPAPIIIAEEKTVGPSLGEDSIMLGKKSAIIAIILVASFMVVVYGIYGVFASIALLFNIIFIMGLMSLLGGTLTMPGIAGIVLTMGMAVDANVLIFERIREELKIKSSVGYAIERGFKQAFATILDSNLTTLIAAFFLYAFGTGVIKGFAVTLTIGILSSMFTAITLTKMMISYWLIRTHAIYKKH